MAFVPWIIQHWPGIIENAGVIGGLLFTGLAFRIDARVRRAETLIEINKQHRELWMHFDERPKLAGLFDPKRDLSARPLLDDEVRFVNFLLNHLRATFYARSAGIYVQPERLADDIRGLFSLPAPRAAWDKLKQSHDRKFVAFVEGNSKAV
jgi:hypothetical protein